MVHEVHDLRCNISIFRQYQALLFSFPYSLSELRLILKIMLKTVVDNGFPIINNLELYIIDDLTISQINKKYLNCIGPTNILSFPSDCEMPASLFLSLDTIFRECVLYGQQLDTYVLRLLAHGIGHLAGLDHGEIMDQLSEKCYDNTLDI